MRVAIFDFDGTIYKHETYTLMLDHAKKHPDYEKAFRAFYFSIVPPYLAYKLKLYPEAKMKYSLTQKYLQLFEGKRKEEVAAYLSEIADKMVADFNELVLERMKQHHERGDYVMVVSGAYEPLLEQALADFPTDCIIGTKIPMQGTYIDPYTPIDHVQSERKTELILEHLKDQAIDWQGSTAYGDSMADLPVLELVGKPVTVCPDVNLQKLANQKRWTIIC